MKIKIVPSHVAVLVPSVRKAADYLRQFDFQIGEEAKWEGEGTREIYVEQDKSNSLLLLEAIKPGPYQRALEKRGPGLHHLAIDVLDIENYIHSLAGSGWFLHPISVKNMKELKTAYLTRPGFPGLIEVQQKDKLPEGSLFVESVSIKLDRSLCGLLKHIGLDEVVKLAETQELVLAGKRIPLEKLF